MPADFLYSLIQSVAGPPTAGGVSPARFSNVVSYHAQVGPGDLFFSFRHDGYDGYSLIPEAIERGASGVVCEGPSPLEFPRHVTTWHVANVLRTFRQLAAAWRKLFDLPVVAVAGSAGKTTTKEMIAALLSGRWPSVHKTFSNFNGYFGVARTMLDLRFGHDAAVVEVGIDEPGAMVEHLEVLRPTVAVVTTIGPEHLERLLDIRTIAREECLVLEHVARQGGLAIVNDDDPWVRAIAATLPREHVIRYRFSDHVPAHNTLHGEILPHVLQLQGLGLDNVLIPIPLPGQHNASNLLAAIATARALGVSSEEMRAGLVKLQPPPGRSEVRKWRSCTMICDFYNSNPCSLDAGLRLLAGEQGTRWACLGDMDDLGSSAEHYHRSVGRTLHEMQLEHVLLYGRRTLWIAEELVSCGFCGEIAHCSSHTEMAEKLRVGLTEGARVLIKGSRSMTMERVWECLEGLGDG